VVISVTSLQAWAATARQLAGLVLVAIVLAAGPAGAEAETCGGLTACHLDGRTYNYLLPENWDGVTPLPVMMHFHAFGRRGRMAMRHPRITGATVPRGVLLVAPTARERAWRFWLANPKADIDFADAVLEDVAKRFPIDRSQFYVSGFSFGGAMAWRYACVRGDRIAGLFTMSGTIPQDSACANTPDHVRHVHGLQDRLMPYPRRGDDLTYAVALWQKRFACAPGVVEGPWSSAPNVSFARMAWRDCAPGRDVTLDIHDGGHIIPEGWLGAQLDALMRR
jgi:polyhydroxybutyrate depolymerase